MAGPIDLRTWKRRDHYFWFRKYDQPFFGATVEVDVTTAWKMSRKSGAASFFLTSLFMMLNAANDVEAFRLRLRPRGVWRHDRVAVGPTIMRPDETFGFARLEPANTLRNSRREAMPRLRGQWLEKDCRRRKRPATTSSFIPCCRGSGSRPLRTRCRVEATRFRASCSDDARASAAE